MKYRLNLFNLMTRMPVINSQNQIYARSKSLSAVSFPGAWSIPLNVKSLRSTSLMIICSHLNKLIYL